MKSHPSFACRSIAVLWISCLVIPVALISCRRVETSASRVSPVSSPGAEPASPHAGTLSTALPPEEVFKRALWRRPAPEDRILHAERREWTEDNAVGVAHWQWFLAVEPGPALKAWLREQDPFSVRPVGNADAPEIKGAPAWFPSDHSGCIVHAGGTTASLVFLWSRQNNTLYATGSGTGFQPGAAGPAASAEAPQTASRGRLPQTLPPTSPTP
jgi:hypothetical protein